MESHRTRRWRSSDKSVDHTGAYGPHPSLLEKAHARVESLVAGYLCPVPEMVQEDLRRYFHDLESNQAT